MTSYPWQNFAARAPLGHWPTPMELLPRLSAELGGPNIWVKRDDCSGLATGGNKTRKLEYLLGDALDQGADTVLTYGAIQSNHARQTAAACNKLGLECHLLLTRRASPADDDYEHGGNVLLDKLLGAHLHLCDTEDAATTRETLLADLAAADKHTYEIPAGGSNAVGALGYAQCAEELHDGITANALDVTHIFHASASAATQSGLLYGLSYLRDDITVLGINVYHPDPGRLEERVADILAATRERFGNGPYPAPVNTNHAYFGAGYGSPTEDTIAAIHMAARLEGLLFDPVYSGKALTGLIDQINLGNIKSADVVLVHTGGTAALPVYSSVLT
ncbi:MAG: D-cysteine desulfhydrase family protein [Pseudomonadota bacterium]